MADLVERIVEALVAAGPELRELHHKHVVLDANARRFIAEIAAEEAEAEVERLRSLLGRLSEPWAPWQWDGLNEGIYCKRCQGHNPTTDLAHGRDLDWHDETCPWRQAREEAASG